MSARAQVKNAEADFQKKISDYIKQEFTLKSYYYNDEYKAYIVKGTIIHCDEQVNVEASIKDDKLTPSYWYITDKEFKMKWRALPDITLSKDVVFSDPCYNRDDGWLITVLHNMKPGEWKVRANIDTISAWGERCNSIELVHSAFAEETSFAWAKKALLPVDSGIISVIDDLFYRREKGSIEDFESSQEAKDKFGDKCYLLSKSFCDIFRVKGESVGVVASSGVGDGEYPLHVAESSGEVIAAKIMLF
ncbi:MAG: hypothetical protein LBT59_18525 [Clostridiales bacterium]|nr:hypothetical protein [Clostridiales bacterium]